MLHVAVPTRTIANSSTRTLGHLPGTRTALEWHKNGNGAARLITTSCKAASPTTVSGAGDKVWDLVHDFETVILGPSLDIDVGFDQKRVALFPASGRGAAQVGVLDFPRINFPLEIILHTCGAESVVTCHSHA